MKDLVKKDMHWARWNEPLIYELGSKGERGIIPPQLEQGIIDAIGEAADLVPAGMLRKEAPTLPEIAQLQIVRHWTRLSEMTSATDNCIDFGLGTCTMKYSPKVNDAIVNMHQLQDLHPWQDDETTQGTLEIIYEAQEYLKEISGMDAVNVQAAAGGGSVWTNVCLIRKYQEERGFGLDKKDEIISTIFSHPCNQATGSVGGFKLVILYPDENGYPPLEEFAAAVNERTAGLILGSPDDTGIFNQDVKKWTELVHEVGGLCVLDQANANGVLGVARAREMGFDMSHFNLHKTFSSPHGSLGPGAGATCCRDFLAKYLPTPHVEFDGEKYHLNFNTPDTIGKVRSYYGNIQVVTRACAWIMSLGAQGLKTVAHTAVLNDNYVMRRLLNDVKGISLGYPHNEKRFHEIRFCWEELFQDTGLTTFDIQKRLVDYGFNQYFSSHEPFIVPNPMTPEPAETYSKRDLDEFVDALGKVSWEAYNTPEVFKGAPHKAPVSGINVEQCHSMEKLSTTWKAWKANYGE